MRHRYNGIPPAAWDEPSPSAGELWMSRARQLEAARDRYRAARSEISEVAAAVVRLRRSRSAQRPPSVFRRSASRKVHLFGATDALLADLADLRTVKPGALAASIVESVVRFWGCVYPYDDDLHLRRCEDPSEADFRIEVAPPLRPDFRSFCYSGRGFEAFSRLLWASFALGRTPESICIEVHEAFRAWELLADKG